MALPLIKDEICEMSMEIVATWRNLSGMPLDTIDDMVDFFNRDKMVAQLTPIGQVGYADAVDYSILYFIAYGAQTYLFDTEQIRLFLRAIDRKIPPRTVQPPFHSMIVQFTEPIPEREFLSGYFTGGGHSSGGDRVKGIVIGWSYEGADTALGDDDLPDGYCNAIIWYESRSLNRSSAPLDGDGSASGSYTEGYTTEEGKQDKQRIINLAMLILSYLNSPGIETEKVEAPAAINKRRIKDKKKPIEPHYICKVDRRRVVYADHSGEPTGRHVSYRFDVQGHFRHFKDGRAVWIKAHQRGLEHERYVPKVYRVEKEDR